MAQAETPQGKTEHGIWYAAPSYDAGADETTFTVEPLANLASFQVGYKVLLDTRTPTYHTITAAGGDTFTVKGQLTPTMGNTDAHEIGSAGDWFRVMTPYGKDAQTGELDQELSMKGSRQGLWGGYRWMPPEGPNGSTASFSNKYYCHNRTYDTRTGRWSTPDPAASPWWNLQDYVGNNPLQLADPSGLQASDKLTATPLEGKTKSDAKDKSQGEWKWEEHKRGRWDGTDSNGNPISSIGLVVKLQFTRDAKCKSNCDEVRLLQVSRMSKRTPGGTFTYDKGTHGSAFDTKTDNSKGVGAGYHVDQPIPGEGWYGGYKATRVRG